MGKLNSPCDDDERALEAKLMSFLCSLEGRSGWIGRIRFQRIVIGGANEIFHDGNPCGVDVGVDRSPGRRTD